MRERTIRKLSGEVTVIIAARDEERLIGDAVDSAFAAGAAEVILADGTSTDRTREIAASRGAQVIECPPMRSRQFNLGARRATKETLIFLHADTTLPPGAAAAASDALAAGAYFGGFRVRFAERSHRLRIVAALINLRTKITRRPWGDQVQFIARSRFLAEGGFREIPLMEDYELATRMKQRVLLPLTVTTSGRRFLKHGILRTTARNWLIIAAWRAGVGVERLERWYRAR